MKLTMTHEYIEATERMALIPVQTRGFLDLKGPDTRKYLNGMVTNDISKLEDFAGCYSLICTHKGKVLADFFVYSCGDDHFCIECDLGLRNKVRDLLKRAIIFQKVALKDQSEQWHVATVIGPKSKEAVRSLKLVPPEQPLHFGQSSWQNKPVWIIAKNLWGLPAYELWTPAGITISLAFPILSFATQEILRIESATPKYGVDFDETHLPQEAGLLHALSFNKGCYVGQETIARLQHLGHVNKQLTLAKSADEKIDKVTSRCESPKYQSEIRLGYAKFNSSR